MVSRPGRRDPFPARPDLPPGAPHSWIQPVPDVTTSVWPAGWECHAVRAPGWKVTWLAVARVCSVAATSGSITTEPVKLSADPRGEGLAVIGGTSMPCPWAGAAARRPSAMAAAR